MQQILTAQTENTDGTSTRIAWYGGYGTFKADGTFDGCTVTLVCSETGGTLVSCGADGELTADGVADFGLWPKGDADVMDVSVKVTDAGALTSINAFIGSDRGCRAFQS